VNWYLKHAAVNYSWTVRLSSTTALVCDASLVVTELVVFKSQLESLSNGRWWVLTALTNAGLLSVARTSHGAA